MNPILEVKNLVKIKDNKKIVDNLSFSVYKGEVFGFLGPNGAGKTTTIKMITGLYNIDEGEIYIDSKNVKTDFEQALSNVGAIIENPEMYSYMSGMDNLLFYSNMHKKVSKERLEEIIKLVKLENRINDKVKKYSLGMRQRLGLAQALLHNPKLIILDEPTNGLDPIGIKELRETLRELCQTQGASVLVSSHLLSEMEMLCDRFLIIDNGKFIDIKSIKDIENKDSNILTYKVVVDDYEKSSEIIQNKFNHINFKIEETLILESSKEDIANIIKHLVENNINIYEVSIQIKTLEDEFINLTSGSKNQIR